MQILWQETEFQASCLQKVTENSQQSGLCCIRSCGQVLQGTGVHGGLVPLDFLEQMAASAAVPGPNKPESHLSPRVTTTQQSTAEWVTQTHVHTSRVCVYLGECMTRVSGLRWGTDPLAFLDTTPSPAQAGLFTQSALTGKTCPHCGP